MRLLSKILLLSCIGFTSLSSLSFAEQSKNDQGQVQKRPGVIELQSTIVGNQEQPEVIYIIPWQQIDAPEPSYQPMQQLIDGQFEPLDRDEWRRKIDLDNFLNKRKQVEE